ncbi:DUF4411 family protein [Microbacterium sp. NPDC090281]|uniref:DUF4411 family protein n=1 Tax=Microbacterium sp. NPDC090281 TaxID=3364208 RepID=UPI0037F71E5D
MSFTLDTNILIRMAAQYPRDIFPSVWERLEELIDARAACICDEVHEEVHRGTDELYEWAKAQDGFVCDVGGEEIALAAEISEDYPEWVRESQNAADPFLIAHAEVTGLTIVSDEREAGANVTPRNQKVPNVARARGVRCLNFFGMATELGWRF